MNSCKAICAIVGVLGMVSASTAVWAAPGNSPIRPQALVTPAISSSNSNANAANANGNNGNSGNQNANNSKNCGKNNPKNTQNSGNCPDDPASP